jgi:hypothetical protein
MATGNLSFLFGTTDHGSKTSMNMLQAPDDVGLKQNRAAFVLPCPEPTIPSQRGFAPQDWVFTNNRECKYIH